MRRFRSECGFIFASKFDDFIDVIDIIDKEIGQGIKELFDEPITPYATHACKKCGSVCGCMCSRS